MERRDRDRIDQFCDEILPEINIRHLWPRLIEFGVFNEDDANIPDWEENLENQDTIRDILLAIKTRGPVAFQNFVRSLRVSGHAGPADILEGTNTFRYNNILNNDNNATNNRTGSGITPFREDEYYKNLQMTQDPLQINVRKATRFLDTHLNANDRSYPMRSNPRGLVLIITIINYINEERRGAAEHDEANLKKLFEDMGFEVTTHNDLTGADILRVVEEFSKRREMQNVSSCFVIISGHGAELQKNGIIETEIQGIDYQFSSDKVVCNDIIDMFTAERCRHLCGKPKVFIFQVCRGRRRQRDIRSVTDGMPTGPQRNYSDILVAHSTMPGFYAYRDNINGSWYIQILCEVFMNHACERHLWDLFCMVDRRLKSLCTENNELQTSTVKSIGFNRHCFLNPGLFEDSDSTLYIPKKK